MLPPKLEAGIGMRATIKDRIVNILLIVFFFAAMGGSAYYIYKTMIHWRVKGLG